MHSKALKCLFGHEGNGGLQDGGLLGLNHHRRTEIGQSEHVFQTLPDGRPQPCVGQG